MPTRENAPLGAPCWIDLFTSDPDASRAFYADLLGWTADEPNEEFGGYFNFRLGEAMIAGGMRNSEPDKVPDMWNVYLAVADAEATTAAAAAAGAPVFVPAMAVGTLGSMAVIADPGGASIGIWQPGEHKGFGVLAEPGAPAWFELHTNAYDTVRPFYSSVFGWDLTTMSDEPSFRYSTLGQGDGALAGVMDSKVLPDGEPDHWAIYFNVADADASAARIVELGGKVLQGPDDTPFGRLLVATDPTGAPFRLVQ
ncbi:VOC family protein [Aquihabitans sp. McL0605]|uniref:VOC family protein n=1 Tax=Aquihabitans sp. McL0605 TaxID=3415671 RepID=UPI003CE82F61